MNNKSSKFIAIAGATALMAFCNTCTAMAAETIKSLYRTVTSDGSVRELEWKTDDKGSWYQYTDDGSYPRGQWLWISAVNGNGYCSGKAFCVYIKNDGYIFNSRYDKVYMSTGNSDEALRALDGYTSPDGYPVDISGIWTNKTGTEIIRKDFPEITGTSKNVTTENGETKTFYNDADYSKYVTEKLNKQYTEDYIANQVDLAIKATNAQRRKRGIAELEYDSSLDELTQLRANEISENFTHTLPEGGSVGTKYHLAENIAFHTWGDSEPGKFVVDQLWMNSSGHKANLLNKNAKKINIKAAVIPDSAGAPLWYWVQIFEFD